MNRTDTNTIPNEQLLSTHNQLVAPIPPHLVIYWWLYLLIRAQPQQPLPRFEDDEEEEEGEDDYELSCSDCAGTGDGEDGEPEGCDTCDGTGELPVIVGDPPDDEEE